VPAGQLTSRQRPMQSTDARHGNRGKRSKGSDLVAVSHTPQMLTASTMTGIQCASKVLVPRHKRIDLIDENRQLVLVDGSKLDGG